MNKTAKFSGYAVFAGCLLLMIFPGGLLSYAPGLFMYPICQELGFTTAQYSITNTVSATVNAIVSAFFVQYLSKGKRSTMRAIMIVSGIVTCGGFSLLGKCSELWQFYVMFGVSNLGYNMLTFVPVGMLITNWFVKKRALLTGIAYAGSNLGGAIFSTVVSQMIASQGWRNTFIICGLICLAAVAVAVLLIKRSPSEYGQKALGEGENSSSNEPSEEDKVWLGVDKKNAMRSPAFFLICAAMLLTGIYAAGITNHITNFLCMGTWEITTAGTVMTVFTLVGVLGNSVGGAIVGKAGIKRSALLGIGCLLVAIVCLTFGNTIKPLAYVWATLQGFATFMSVLLPSLIVSSTFGSRDYAGIYGFAYAFYLVGCALSAPFIALISDAAGYEVAWIVVLALVVILGLLHLRCIAYGKRFREKYPD